MNQEASGGLIALVQDAFATVGLPASNTVGFALQHLLRRRREDARDILLGELKRGQKTLHGVNDEDGAAILYRYLRAAQEGAAKLNLGLMAKVIAGQAVRGNLVADEFLYYADILASLRREEILLVATLWRYTNSAEVMDLEEGRRVGAAMQAAQSELVPLPFPTGADFVAAAGAVMRTGLITMLSGFDAPIFVATPLLGRLQALASFSEALDDEEKAAR